MLGEPISAPRLRHLRNITVVPGHKYLHCTEKLPEVFGRFIDDLLSLVFGHGNFTPLSNTSAQIQPSKLAHIPERRR